MDLLVAVVAAASIPLGPAPAPVGRLCGEVAQQKPAVLCPTRFPLRARSHVIEGRALSRDDYPGYLVEWHVTRFHGDDLGHVVVGGQPAPFDLSRGARVRADGALGLPGRKKLLRRTKVGTADALVLRSPPYPRGGINGGHTVVLWNAGGRGYFVSLHFDGYPLHERVVAAVRTARSSAAVKAGEARSYESWTGRGTCQRFAPSLSTPTMPVCVASRV